MISERYEFEDKGAFVTKLEELVKGGTPRERINTMTPYHVHEAEEILEDEAQSSVRFFTATGALTGFATGFGFTIYTVLAWPIIVAGKHLVSLPPFMVIAYELTILFGCLASFAGFLFLSRMPALSTVISKSDEFSDKFIIEVGEGRY